jgi:hypothetical protein
MIGRRRFLALGVAAAGGAALAIVGYRRRLWHRAWRRLWPRPVERVYTKRELQQHLQRTFAYLHPDVAGVERYVDLYLAHYHDSPSDGDLPQFETTFLLSTNFFQSGQPTSGPIQFVALFHPYVSPCYNPLVQSTGREMGPRRA